MNDWLFPPSEKPRGPLPNRAASEPGVAPTPTATDPLARGFDAAGAAPGSPLTFIVCGAGPFAGAEVRPMMRVGREGEPGGEHVWLEAVAGYERPDPPEGRVHGSLPRFRAPMAGLTDEQRAICARAPSAVNA